MFYKNEDHKKELLQKLQEINRIYPNGKADQEYLAALYIITSSPDLRRKTFPYIDTDGIDFSEILKEVDFSSGENVFIRLAGNLFNGNLKLEPLDLCWVDDDNFRIAIQAMIFRRKSFRLEEL